MALCSVLNNSCLRDETDGETRAQRFSAVMTIFEIICSRTRGSSFAIAGAPTTSRRIRTPQRTEAASAASRSSTCGKFSRKGTMKSSDRSFRITFEASGLENERATMSIEEMPVASLDFIAVSYTHLTLPTTPYV